MHKWNMQAKSATSAFIYCSSYALDIEGPFLNFCAGKFFLFFIYLGSQLCMYTGCAVSCMGLSSYYVHLALCITTLSLSIKVAVANIRL